MSQQAQQLIAQAKAEGWKRLELGNCGLSDLETQVPELFELEQLEELVLSNVWWDMDKQEWIDSANGGEANHLSQLPPAMAQLKQLKVLICGGRHKKWTINDISVLKELRQLTTLDLRENQIIDILPLQGLTALTTLSLSHNQIIDILPLRDLTTLTILLLGDNQIIDILPLQGLTALTTLRLWQNQIIDILPLQGLTALTTLDLSFNQISELSPLLPFLQREKNPLQLVSAIIFLGNNGEININSNPLANPPMEIAEQGTEAVLRYFETTRAKNNVVKMVLLGNSTVGKTSLLSCLIRGVFPKTNSTHGIIVEDWLLNNTNILVRVWDFGGQAYYHATHRLYLSRNAVYLVLWATETNRKGKIEVTLSLADSEGNSKPVTCLLDMEHYAYWLDTVRYYGGDKSPLLLVQNKTEQKKLPTDTERQQYQLFDDHIFHLDCKKAFVEPKGKMNVRDFESFNDTLTDLLKTHAQQIELTNYWLPLAEWVKETAKQQNTMPYATFVAACKAELQNPKYGGLYENEVLDEQAIKNLFIYLHDMTSTVLYYPQIAALKDTVFINPNWLNDNIYRILSRDIVDKQKGEFTLQHVADNIVAADPIQMIALMKHFELIFAKPGCADTYIAPQYLPEKCESDLQTLDYDYPVFTIRFGNFLPRSVFLRFIAQYGEQALNYWYWKTGIIFKQNKTFIFAQHKTIEQKQYINLDANQPLGNEDKKQLFDTLKKIIDHNNFEIAVVADVFEPYNELLKHYNRYKTILPDFAFLFVTSPTKNNISLTMNHKDHLTQLVAQGKLKQAITELHEATRQNGQSDLYNNITHLLGRFNTNENSHNNNTISHDNYQLELNRIRHALLACIGEYEPNGDAVFTPSHHQNTTNGNNNIIIQGANNSTINVGGGNANTNPIPPKDPPQTILFLAANPSNEARLQTDKEHRTIKDEMRGGKHRDRYEFLPPQFAVTITELIRAMNDKPNIVHFSGHGTKGGIVIATDDNSSQTLPSEALKRLFKNAKDTQLVLLNACYSAEQAKLISQFGMYVIGNSLPIGDNAAISFAQGLYNGLGEGKTIESAYNDAMMVLLTKNPDYAHVVCVWKDGNQLDW